MNIKPVKFLITARFCLADFLEDYLFLTVGRVGGTTTNIEQKVMDVEEFERTNKLIEILTTMGQYCIFVLQLYCEFKGTNRTLVFVETKRTADFLATFLSDNNFPTTSIHGYVITNCNSY